MSIKTTIIKNFNKNLIKTFFNLLYKGARNAEL